MNPKYPIYIISKGRWESRLTAKALEAMGIPFRIVIEPQEESEYARVVDQAKILVLPFSNLGRGSIPARNWVWEHSIEEGHERHWILDDNLKGFVRFNHNRKSSIASGECFAEIERMVDRYTNVAMAGMQYSMFAFIGKVARNGNSINPVIFNTRIYSCILLSNRIPQRWRGRYNEDTDLSLRILKSGFCTILFNAFLCEKKATMTMKGGNTDHLYRQDSVFDGRLAMAKSLQKQHPDVVKVVRKYGRWQHQVNYRPFKKNKLIRKPDLAIPHGPNEYGMKCIRAAK